MLKKTMTYQDFDGNERTETFYFHLTEAELTEMELTTKEGLVNTINKIIESQDTESMVKIFKDLILKAYGEKSADGKYFVKSKEISDSFAHTEAYSVLFMELAMNADAASAFINGIIPQKLTNLPPKS